MYEPYDEKAASAEDRVAWALCQIIDDDAPMRWTRYRGVANCIAAIPSVMADLQELRDQKRSNTSLTGGCAAQEKPDADR
ncbi:hypothetical protein [Solimonas marina]|uniref:Uncharacterized protein n=1 Tax=Solimonas marina TaxID=2714601 RepID=A0A970B7T6_9GAMM|nr:hypothetical protein [Solimonas marina]NKF21564.1 hypothetical protein [Solimonas marina]